MMPVNQEKLKENIIQLKKAIREGKKAISFSEVGLEKAGEEAEQQHYITLAKINNPVSILAEQDHYEAVKKLATV